MSYLVYLKLPDLLYYIILTTTRYCEKNEIYEKKAFFLNFLNSTIISTHDEGKRKEKRKSRPKSKIKNIVILINYICLNLFEQHHCC